MGGYYRFPTVYNDQVVFTCEDDLWMVNRRGGVARRLTAGKSMLTHPHFSPDGRFIAFTGSEEGYTEVFVLPTSGGVPKRLTYLDSNCYVVGWHPTEMKIIFASNAAQPFDRIYMLYAVSLEAELPELLPVGIAATISFGPQNGMVIGRNTIDLARWKRYRGGKTGDIWIDSAGNGEFHRFLELDGNIARPLWIGRRIYFLSDHEGVGNIFSCNLEGADLQRHTRHTEFYARQINTDGKQIIYHSGAELFIFNPNNNKVEPFSFEYRSTSPQRKRKFASPWRFLEAYDLHPSGRALTITCRGKAFAMFNWEGGVNQLGKANGKTQGIRYRLPRWLIDGTRLVVISDATEEEALEIHHFDESSTIESLDQLDIGRALNIEVSPQEELVALTNHRMELLLIDLKEKTMHMVDQSQSGTFGQPAWSPDGNWLVYSKQLGLHQQALFLYELKTDSIFPLTLPGFWDYSPDFDPDGKYIYFLSYRSFDPVSDSIFFDFSFPYGVRPYLITLRKDLPSPFVPKAPDMKDLLRVDPPEDEDDEESEDSENNKNGEDEKDWPIQIDLDGIERRILPFPVAEGRYSKIRGVKNRAIFTSYPVQQLLSLNTNSKPSTNRTLKIYNFEKRKITTIKNGVSNFRLSLNRKTVLYRSGNELRIVGANEKDFEKLTSNGYSDKSGWVDLNRANIAIIPQDEWRQMFREAWRLQRDYFWTEDMSGVDWKMIYARYFPLIERVGTRSEINALIYEMQGELGTSHAYVSGGDFRSRSYYAIGFLGADFEYNAENNGYRIQHIFQGDCWNRETDSPLNQLGLDIREGDFILEINGHPLNRTLTPNQELVNHAEDAVFLTILRQGAEPLRQTISVTTVFSETPIRYREWVETNRDKVHQATDGRVGYVHIPDMDAQGYAEFHRYFQAELDREGLIVDVRFNNGGNISQLILEKLARRRLGYEKRRWGEPVPYPVDSIIGPVVAIANEFSASDGDIFSHGFKLMKLGPLIGKRTWGGVIGYYPRASLVDGGSTTQPESSHWFKDVGWKLENYGTEPDIEVEITPQDYTAGKDPQLNRSIEIILDLLQKNPPQLPDFGERPRLGR